MCPNTLDSIFAAFGIFAGYGALVLLGIVAVVVLLLTLLIIVVWIIDKLTGNTDQASEAGK